MTNLDTWLKEHEDWQPFADLVVIPPDAEEAEQEFPELAGTELLRDEYAMTSFGVTRLALYTRLRRQGQSHKFAELVAIQRPPRCMTDDVFFAGMPKLADQMTPSQLQFYVARARSMGYNPGTNDVYHSGLARFPGDPEAFVSKAMGRGYIKKLCEQRGWACEGAVNVAARQPEKDALAPENCVPLAEDLVRHKACEMVKANPDLRTKSKSELRKMVIAKHGPSA